MIMGASESKACKALASWPLTQRIHLVREIASRGYKDAVDLSACRALVKTYPHHHLKEPIVSRAARQVLRSLVERILIISESALGPIKKQSDRYARVAIFLLLDTEVDNGVAICGEVRSLSSLGGRDTPSGGSRRPPVMTGEGEDGWATMLGTDLVSAGIEVGALGRVSVGWPLHLFSYPSPRIIQSAPRVDPCQATVPKLGGSAWPSTQSRRQA